MSYTKIPGPARNPLWQAVDDLSGNAAFAKFLSFYCMGVSHRTIYQWKLYGYVPRKYLEAIRLLIKDMKPFLTDPQGLLDCAMKQKIVEPVFFPNLRLDEFVKTHGGPVGVLKQLNTHFFTQWKKTHPENEWRDFKPKFPSHLHNWMRAGRIPVAVREDFMKATGCPVQVLDAEIIKYKPDRDKILKDRAARLAAADRAAYEHALTLPYPTAASIHREGLADLEKREKSFINPLGDDNE